MVINVSNAHQKHYTHVWESRKKGLHQRETQPFFSYCNAVWASRHVCVCDHDWRDTNEHDWSKEAHSFK